MKHDSTKSPACKPHSTRSGSPGLISIGSRESVANSSINAKKLGASHQSPQSRNTGSAVADLVPGGRGAEKPRVFLWEAAAAVVRVVGSTDAPWFVAKDVCSALDVGNPTEAVRNLDEDEKGLRITETLGGKQEMVVVNESGLYALIFRSRKEQARVFRKWVTSEVLPQIRKTGAYSPAAAFVGRHIEIHHRPALPEVAPSEEQLVAGLLFTVLGDRRRVVIRAGTLVDLALRDRQFEGWFKDAADGYQRTSGFMRRLVAYFDRPLVPGISSNRIYLTPHGEGRMRRYVISLAEPEIVASGVIRTPAAEAVEIVSAALGAGGEVVVK